MMDPYRQDKDQGDKSNYQIFSNGPYKLEGKWNKNKGGTLRPQHQLRPEDRLDRHPQGAAGQDRLHQVGQTTEMINDRLIADSGDDQYAVTDRAIPPAVLHADHGRGRGPLRRW